MRPHAFRGSKERGGEYGEGSPNSLGGLDATGPVISTHHVTMQPPVGAIGVQNVLLLYSFPMTLTIELDLNRVKLNHNTKYLGKGNFDQKLSHRQERTHTQPTDCITLSLKSTET